MNLLSPEVWSFPGFKSSKARYALGSLGVGIAQFSSGARYDIVVAEGVSGRIPALVIAGIYKNMLGLDKAPSVVTLLPHKNVPLNQSFFPGSVAPTRPLLVTEHTASGAGIESVVQSLCAIGAKKGSVDIATVVSASEAQIQLRNWADPNQTLFFNEPYTDSQVYQHFYTLQNKPARAQSECLATPENTHPFTKTSSGQDSVARERILDEIELVITEFS